MHTCSPAHATLLSSRFFFFVSHYFYSSCALSLALIKSPCALSSLYLTMQRQNLTVAYDNAPDSHSLRESLCLQSLHLSYVESRVGVCTVSIRAG